jgi:hypothetical protein
MSGWLAFLRLSCALGLGALVTIHLDGESIAQQSQGDDFPEFATFDLFEGDYTDPNPEALAGLVDAIRGVEVPADCPLGQLRIRTSEGDPLFQEALAAARRDAVLAALDGQGVDVAGRLFVESTVFGGEGGHDAAYEFAGDDQPPSLTTTSQPPAGTKVEPGRQIIVRMAARDDANRWQTGIKSIQLVADSEDGRFIAAENYEPCAEPTEKRVQATYEVPADPPPIVRLTALTEDHSGLVDNDTAQFPTSEWYGTYTVANPIEGTHQTRIEAEIALNHDDSGNLTGTLVGRQELVPASEHHCSYRMNQPNRFRISLAGSYAEGRAPKVVMKELEETMLIVGVLCDGTPPQQYEVGIANYIPYGHLEFLGPLGMMGEGTLQPDGSRHCKYESGTATFELTLHRAGARQ